MKTHLTLLLALALGGGVALGAGVSEQITVDQFGWRASASNRVVVFAQPVTGQNSGTNYTPGSTFQLQRVSDGATLFTGSVVAWGGGLIHTQSGDRVWWGDFSSFNTPGTYRIRDPSNDLQSYEFAIRDDLFNDILNTSVRTFYYQRCGAPIPPGYGGNWNHAICHTQDCAAPLWTTSDQGDPRDVSGGWHDAGDYNKYVPFTLSTLWHLMMAYELCPAAHGDDLNIPESGNRVPDLLDEIKWELDWLLKMQDSDGSVFNRVTVLTYGSDYPQDDTLARYHTRATTWATASAAASLAHGARVFTAFDSQYPGYSNALTAAAENAWAWLESNPNMYPADGTDGASMAAAAAGSDTNDDRRRRVLAAAELYAATGTPKYRTYFDGMVTNIALTQQGAAHPLTGAQPSMLPDAAWALNAALIVYLQTAYPTNSSIAATARTSLKNGADWYTAGNYESANDAYRAFMWNGHYCWGSNQMKALWAILPIMAIHLNVQPSRNNVYQFAAEEYLHYIHGRNPLSYCHLSNMGTKGAGLGGDKPVMEPYHGWFKDGSALYDGAASLYGPAPGYLAGGPNYFFGQWFVAPPYGEPHQKAFKDWNTGWNDEHHDNENSWEITEPSIYCQASYTLVLAYFCAETADTDFDRMPDAWERDYFNGIGRHGTGDWDKDGMTDAGEYIAGTNPTNDLSVLKITAQELEESGANMVMWWNSATGRVYSVNDTTNLAWSSWKSKTGATNMTGTGGPMSYTNVLQSAGPGFYRIGVKLDR